MRRFSSYGPVDPEAHFCVRREALVEKCVEQLVGNPEKGGHYFTIWAPRQTGKTWLMRRAIEEIRSRHSERFAVGTVSMQGVALRDEAPAEEFLERVPGLFKRWLGLTVDEPRNWDEWTSFFLDGSALFDKPVILLIDEFDTLPAAVINRLVELYRDTYLNRRASLLHGLALVGVRAVLGAESDRGSPFNVQRSLKVDNLTRDEVHEMFEQYQVESGQVVESEVRDAVYDATRGQPGLVSWFGELLTEKYNPRLEETAEQPGREPVGQRSSEAARQAVVPISMDTWKRTFLRALRSEWNNTVLNLVKKVRRHHAERVVALFSQADIPFSIDEDWASYLYLNGIIDYQATMSPQGEETLVCIFSSPFVQQRLFNALTEAFYDVRGPILALEPGDLLDDVFTARSLDLPALLDRYKAYLARLKARSVDPWEGHPRRKTDLHLPEAIGHFHLYAWLREAIGHRSLITPEFPTGNGKVDLVVRHEEQVGVIEVKSFRDSYELQKSYSQTAKYARGLGLDTATLVVFVPVRDESLLEQMSGETHVDGVRVVTVAIGWG